MAKPRILLVLTEFPPSFGGMQTHAVELATRLAENSYPIRVLTYRTAQADHASALALDRHFPFPVSRCLSRLSYWANVSRIAAAARSFSADLIYSSTIYYGQAAQQLKLPMLCRSAGNDVLRPWIAWPFRPASRLLDAPLFERHIYPLLRRWHWPERCDHLLQSARFSLLRDSALQMRHIAANSDFTRQQLLSLGVPAERIEVLSGGVDIQRFAPGPAARAAFGWPADAFLLLTACRLVAKKGLPLLLDAVARLSREIPSLCLAVVGDGPERASLERYAHDRGLTSRVFWTGRLEQSAMPTAYRSADLFVLASRTARRRGGVVDVETMGRVLCEANAAGLPVLASANGGIPSIVTHERNGLLFPEGDLDALCSSLRRLYQEPGLRSSLRQNGLLRAQQEFSWDRLCTRQFDLFDQLAPGVTSDPVSSMISAIHRPLSVDVVNET